MLTLDNHFTSTYSKTLLDNWPVPNQLIYKNTLWIKETLQPQTDMETLISDQQMNDALNGPFQHFFKPVLNAYAFVARIETALNLSKEDFFKEAETAADMTLGVAKKQIEKTELSKLKELQVRLDEVTKQCYEQWETNIRTWTETLLADFKKMNLDLTDGETQDFATNEPASELNGRFVNLKVPAPKLAKSEFDFSQYFTAKAVIAIHSALNRMQQPNTEKDILEKLKNLAPTLKLISKTEKELAGMHKKTIEHLID